MHTWLTVLRAQRADLTAVIGRCWQVWRVLTDYERLAEFVPNLERCVRLPRGPNGRVRLRQARSAVGALLLLLRNQRLAAVTGSQLLACCIRLSQAIEVRGKRTRFLYAVLITYPGECCAQRGCSQGTLWRLAAEAVLEVSEARGGLGVRELRFHMIEGDFKVCRRSRSCVDTLTMAGHSKSWSQRFTLVPDYV